MQGGQSAWGLVGGAGAVGVELFGFVFALLALELAALATVEGGFTAEGAGGFTAEGAEGAEGKGGFPLARE